MSLYQLQRTNRFISGVRADLVRRTLHASRFGPTRTISASRIWSPYAILVRAVVDVMFCSGVLLSSRNSCSLCVDERNILLKGHHGRRYVAAVTRPLQRCNILNFVMSNVCYAMNQSHIVVRIRGGLRKFQRRGSAYGKWAWLSALSHIQKFNSNSLKRVYSTAKSMKVI